MKRHVSTGSCNLETKKVLEYDVRRKDVFPWHIPVNVEEATPRAKSQVCCVLFVSTMVLHRMDPP